MKITGKLLRKCMRRRTFLGVKRTKTCALRCKMRKKNS